MSAKSLRREAKEIYETLRFKRIIQRTKRKIKAWRETAVVILLTSKNKFSVL